jgi:fucose 4-O-acetylase-like acetyltransferase
MMAQTMQISSVPIQKTKIKLFDQLRGFASFLIVAGHVMSYFGDPSLTNSMLYNFIWSVQIPIFMIVSGILYSKSTDKISFRFFVKQIFGTIVYLIVPIVSWTITYQLINNITSISIMSLINPIFLYPTLGGNWFLSTLFAFISITLVSLFFNLTKSHTINLILRSVFILIVLSLFLIVYIFLNPLLFGSKYILFYSTFFFPSLILGSFIRANDKLSRALLNLMNKRRVRLLSIFLFALFAALYVYILATCNLVYDESLIVVLLRVLSGYLGSFLLSAILYFACKINFVSKTLMYFGKYTLEIFLVHLFLFNTMKYKNLLVNTNIFIFDFLIYFLIAAAFCFAIIFLFKKIKLLNLLFFGGHGSLIFKKNIKAAHSP